MTSLPDIKLGENLESFIDRVLRPPEEFKNRMSSVVDRVVQHLHQMPGYSIKEIVKSGSLGKGTSVGKTADADLVVFFNNYNTIEALIAAKPRILSDINRYMVQIDQTVITCGVMRTTGYHTQFRFKYKTTRESIEVDVLPAIDVVSTYGGNIDMVYAEMKQKPREIRSHYSVCFCKKQLELIRPKPAKVKDLIRILKYWKNANNLNLRSYCCEVLALYAHDNYLGGALGFNMLTGFGKVLDLLVEVNNLHLTIPTLFYFNTKDWISVFPTSHEAVAIRDCARKTKLALRLN